MTIADIYKVINDECPVFILKNSTGETVKVDNWTRLEQYWLDQVVNTMTISCLPNDKTILIMVD